MQNTSGIVDKTSTIQPPANSVKTTDLNVEMAVEESS